MLWQLALIGNTNWRDIEITGVAGILFDYQQALSGVAGLFVGRGYTCKSPLLQLPITICNITLGQQYRSKILRYHQLCQVSTIYLIYLIFIYMNIQREYCGGLDIVTY